MFDHPHIIEGGMTTDYRGVVRYVNDFQFTGIKRHYVVVNHRAGYVRAWHGHKGEAKYVTVPYGVVYICAVKVDDWSRPSKQAEIHRFTLSDNNPQILYIPPGYVNGFKTITDGALALFFSDKTLEESKRDDYRFPWDYWGEAWGGGPR